MKKAFAIQLLLIICIMCGCGNKSSNNTTNTDISIDTENKEVIIISGENTYEVRVGDDGKLFEYNNGELVKEIVDKKYNGKSIISIPNTNNSSDAIINSDNEIANNVYKSTPNQSSYYINYLEDNGYSKTYTALTYKFAEYIMTNEDEKAAKRIIISEDYLIDYDVDYEYIPNLNLNDYIFD